MKTDQFQLAFSGTKSKFLNSEDNRSCDGDRYKSFQERRKRNRSNTTSRVVKYTFLFFLILTSGLLFAQETSAIRQSAVDENLIVFLADVHVGPNAPNVERSKNNNQQFEEACRLILALRPRPAAIVLAGDLSVKTGLKEDYQLAAKYIKQFKEAGIPFYPMFGNHDDRENFYSVFPEYRQKKPLVPGRLVTKVTMPRADFLLLDSLSEDGKEGLGALQIEWLKKELQKYQKSNKPVYLVAHHQPEQLGILDLATKTPSLLAFIHAHKHLLTDSSPKTPRVLGLQSTAYSADKLPHFGFSYMKMDRWEFVLRPVTFDLDDVWTRRPFVFKIKPEQVVR